MNKSGAQILVSSLIEQGVDTVFSYPGGSVIDIFDALYERKDDINNILTSHEQGAIHAADGYARAGKKTGVVIATSGPGATNLITGLGTAYLDSVPIVAITGNVPRAMLGKDSFQEVDVIAMTIPITKHSFLVKNIFDLPQIIQTAFTIANSGRPGPVVIDIPKDVQQEIFNYTPVGKFVKRPTPEIDKAKVTMIAKAINEAKKPMICFGGGIKNSDAKESLIKLSEKIDSPMASTVMGLSTVSYEHPNFLGMIGMHGKQVCNKAIDECDLLIVVGSRFSDRITSDKNKFASRAVTVHIDIDSSELNKNVTVDYAVQGDANEIMQSIAEQVDAKDCSGWKSYLRKYEAELPKDFQAGLSGVDPLKVIKAVADISNHKAQVVTDVGQHQMLVAQNYEFSDDSNFISSCGLGTMGFGMGAANGAQMACPGKKTVLFTGDGSFHMNLNELAVSVTEKLPIVVVLFNNTVLGMVRQWQSLFYDGRYSNTDLNRKTDFVKLAEAFGAKGIRVDDNSKINDAIKEAFESEIPVVIEFVVDKDYGVYPFIPPGKSFAETLVSPSMEEEEY